MRRGTGRRAGTFRTGPRGVAPGGIRLLGAGILGAGILGAGLLLAACQPGASPAASADAAVDRTFSICPQSGELPPQDVTDQAVEILGTRLRSAGAGTFTTAVGDCIDVTTGGTIDETDLDDLSGTGLVELVPISALRAAGHVAGSELPGDLEPLLSTADIAGATIVPQPGTGQPTLVIELTASGAATLASWSRSHLGDSLALAVDGRSVVLPVVDSPLTAGSYVVGPTATDPPVALRTIAALIASGPLPEAWTQPAVPQG